MDRSTFQAGYILLCPIRSNTDLLNVVFCNDMSLIPASGPLTYSKIVVIGVVIRIFRGYSHLHMSNSSWQRQVKLYNYITITDANVL